MANRYWVGGTASWDATAGTKWALTSGGGGGEAIPTSADDVFLDANSGAVTVSIASGNTGCLSLNCTGFTGTLNMGAITISGSLTLSSEMTFSQTSTGLSFNSTSLGNTITTAGKTFAQNMSFNGVGGEWILQDDLVMTSTSFSPSLTLTNGTFRLNNFNLTTSAFDSNNSNIRGLYLGSGIITLIGQGARGAFTAWNLSTTTNLTFDAGTSTISITSAGTNNKTFAGGDLTYYNLLIKRTAAHIVILSGSNTFNIVTINATDLAQAVRFTSNTTQTVSNFVALGSSGKVITIDSVTADSAATISQAAGTVRCDFLSLKDSVAAGGANFYAGRNSTNVSGNTGWIFTAPPGDFLQMFQ